MRLLALPLAVRVAVAVLKRVQLLQVEPLVGVLLVAYDPHHLVVVPHVVQADRPVAVDHPRARAPVLIEVERSAQVVGRAAVQEDERALV